MRSRICTKFSAGTAGCGMPKGASALYRCVVGVDEAGQRAVRRVHRVSSGGVGGPSCPASRSAAAAIAATICA